MHRTAKIKFKFIYLLFILRKLTIVLQRNIIALHYLQGLIISLVLCYTNNEVRTCLQRTASRYFECCNGSAKRLQDGSMMTGVSHLSAGRTSISIGADTSLLSTTPTQETDSLVKEHLISNGESNNNS